MSRLYRTGVRPHKSSRNFASIHSLSVRKDRHRHPLVAAEQHGAGHRRRPEPLAHVVEGGVERRSPRPSNGSVSWTAPESSRLPTASPTSVRPWRSISGVAAANRARDRRQDRLGLRRRPGQRVRPGGAGEVVEAQPERDCAPDPSGAPHPPGDAVDQPDHHRVDVLRRSRRPAQGVLRPDRASPPAHRAPAVDRGCGTRAWSWWPEARPSIDTSAASGSRATWPTVEMPRSCSFWAVTGPTPHSRSTGSGCRKASSPSGGTTSRPSGLATPLATLARNFVRATPTVIGRPTRSSTSRRSRTAISTGVPDDPPQPADVEERLVDRDALHQRRRVVEDLEDRPAGLGVRRDPGLTTMAPGHRRRAWAPPIADAHAERLGLVAGGQHDAAADDHRPAAQARIVPLLDRGVERVEVGVQDRRLADTNTCSQTARTRRSPRTWR